MWRYWMQRGIVWLGSAASAKSAGRTERRKQVQK